VRNYVNIPPALIKQVKILGYAYCEYDAWLMEPSRLDESARSTMPVVLLVGEAFHHSKSDGFANLFIEIPAILSEAEDGILDRYLRISHCLQHDMLQSCSDSLENL
jgi:hypothetical protein